MALALEQVRDLIRRYRGLRDGRSVWHSHWDDLARVMLPQSAGFASSPAEGASRSEEIFDGTPMIAARGLANAIDAMLWPEGQKAFFIRPEGEGIADTDAVKFWLDDSERRLQAALDDPRARFRQSRGETNRSIVVFGTGILYAAEGNRLSHLLHQSVPLRDGVVFFSEEGEAQGLFRSRTLTVRQAVNKWGVERLGKEVREKHAAKKFEDKVEFLHIVVPRGNGREDALLARNLPYAAYWIEVASEHCVEERGYHEFPFAVPRWDTTSGEDYGRSPGMIALPDSNTLQAMGETFLIAGQRAADPPLAVPNDSSFNEVNTFPGGLAYYDVETAAKVGGVPFFPLQSGANLPLTREMQMDTRQQIFAAFLRNVLNLPVDGPNMTATEIIQRKEEMIREIGPTFGRLDTDYKAVLIERDFKILLRAGAFLPVPEALQGRAIRFEYESPIRKLRQQIEAAAARQWVVELAEVEKIKPDSGALDAVDFDEYARFTGEALGIPGRIMNSKERVGQIREGRAQQMEQARQAELASSVVDTVAKGAGVLSQITGS